jgi:hypothetical protein
MGACSGRGWEDAIVKTRRNPTKQGGENNAMNQFVTTFAAITQHASHAHASQSGLSMLPHWLTMKKRALPRSKF